MRYNLVAISREFGSGGRTVGKLVARRLGVPCYDQELIEQIARESGFTAEFVEGKSEQASHAGWLAAAFADRSVQGMSTQDYLWSVQCRVILELAEKGPCVLVGRCADYILRDRADCLWVFVHADREKRARRIVEVYGETGKDPEERLRDKDKRRASYYEFYTDRAWGDAHNFHIALDSGALGIERCAELVAQLAAE